jgi:hypothetical protein
MPRLNFKAKALSAAKNRKMPVFVAVFLLFSSLAFAENGTRHYERNGGFSYCPPSGWKISKFLNSKYSIVVGPIENKFAANIDFFDEAYDGNIQSYVDEVIDLLELVLDDYVVLHRYTFITNAGLTGERVIINSTQRNSFLRQIHYFLQAPDHRHFTITCSVSDSVAEKYLSLFEDSVKTFEFIE